MSSRPRPGAPALAPPGALYNASAMAALRHGGPGRGPAPRAPHVTSGRGGKGARCALDRGGCIAGWCREGRTRYPRWRRGRGRGRGGAAVGRGARSAAMVTVKLDARPRPVGHAAAAARWWTVGAGRGFLKPGTGPGWAQLAGLRLPAGRRFALKLGCLKHLSGWMFGFQTRCDRGSFLIPGPAGPTDSYYSLKNSTIRIEWFVE